MKSIIKKIYEVLLYYKYLHLQKGANSNYSKKIIGVFTNPRSGSTWITDIIKKERIVTTIWEPLFKYNKYKINKLNPFAYPELHEVGFNWNQPIPENEKWEEAKQFFEKLFKQEIINLKLYRFNKFSEISKSQILIFKFCFCNLLLPWIVNNFNITPIFFIRHPVAVVASQLERWGRAKNYKKYIIGNFKYNDIYLKYSHIFDKIKSPEEYLAAEWALTNVYLVKHPYNNIKWLTVSYENIITNSQNELDRIFSYLNIKPTTNVLHKIFTPSFTTDNSKDFDFNKQLSKWKQTLSRKQIDRILYITGLFEVDFYDDNLMPNNEILYNL
jgi:hypothetical protein